MKKLMILVLVLGFVSTANAALVLSINGDTSISEITVAPSDTFLIDVYQTQTGLQTEWWVSVTGPASYTGNGTSYVPPMPSGMVVDDGGYGVGNFQGRMDSPTTDGQVGKWWDLELHCDAEGDVVVNLYDPTGGTVIDTATIHQVPEPMTIALLGLGGLFLRRRKQA